MPIEENLENYLIAFEPEHFLHKLACDIKSLYENRYFVRMAPCTDDVVSHIANLIKEAIESGKRFRVYDNLRTLKIIIKNDDNFVPLNSETVDLLFAIYKKYIFSENEPIQWCVSVYLKDRELSDSEITWLIENEEKSEHILNRLLRYPVPNPIIKEWAYGVLKVKRHENRLSEVIGKIIDDKIPDEAIEEDVNTLMWAVYYSHCSTEKKIELIYELISEKSINSGLDIALRLQSKEILKRVIEMAS